MKQVRNATILVAIVVMMMATACWAQTQTGSGQVISTEPAAQMSGMPTQSPAPLEEVAAAPVVKGDTGQSGRDGRNGLKGQNGQSGQPGQNGRNGHNGTTGLRGPQGPAGRPGKDHVPGHGNALSILHGTDPQHHHWNVVSGSYVDAHDNLTLSRAKDYSDGIAKGMSTTSRHNNWNWWSWLWPILLFLLGILFLVALFRTIFGGGGTGGGFWTRLWRRFNPEPKPVPAAEGMTNTDSGDYYGYDTGEAKVELSCDGSTVVKKWKGYKNISAGDGGYTWAESNQTVAGKFKVGEKVNFALSRENIGDCPISTEGVRIRDDFHALKFGKLIPDSGELWISGKKVRPLDDAFIARVVSGAVISPFDEVIDEIPAHSSVSIVYGVQCIPTSGGGVGPSGAPASENQQSHSPRFKLADIEAEWKAEADKEAKAKAEADAAQKAEAAKAEPVQPAAEPAKEPETPVEQAPDLDAAAAAAADKVVSGNPDEDDE